MKGHFGICLINLFDICFIVKYLALCKTKESPVLKQVLTVQRLDARQQFSTSRVHRHYLKGQCHMTTRCGSQCGAPRANRPATTSQREKER